jgi:hypothetical protein
MTSVDPLIVLCSLVPILYVSIFVHEVGHVLMGRAVGFVVTSFGLGLAHPWVVIPCGRARIFFCRSHPLQGVSFCFIPPVFPQKAKTILFLAGGIVANGLFMVIALLCWRWLSWGSSIWITAAAVNGLFATSGLVPSLVQVGKTPLRSDGRLILQTLQNQSLARPAPMTIQVVDSLRACDFFCVGVDF